MKVRGAFTPLVKLVLAIVTVLTLGAMQGTVDGSTAVEGGGLAILSGVCWQGFNLVKRLIESIDRLNDTAIKVLEWAMKAPGESKPS